MPHHNQRQSLPEYDTARYWAPFFLAYVNDPLPTLPTATSMYAEDKTLWNPNLEPLQLTMDNENSWFKDDSLPINDGKCDSVDLSRAGRHNNHQRGRYISRGR